MAKNLRAKIPSSDTLVIRDVNDEAVERFVAESKELASTSELTVKDAFKVDVAASSREIAERSVSELWQKT